MNDALNLFYELIGKLFKFIFQDFLIFPGVSFGYIILSFLFFAVLIAFMRSRGNSDE